MGWVYHIKNPFLDTEPLKFGYWKFTKKQLQPYIGSAPMNPCIGTMINGCFNLFTDHFSSAFRAFLEETSAGPGCNAPHPMIKTCQNWASYLSASTCDIFGEVVLPRYGECPNKCCTGALPTLATAKAAEKLGNRLSRQLFHGQLRWRTCFRILSPLHLKKSTGERSLGGKIVAGCRSSGSQSGSPKASERHNAKTKKKNRSVLAFCQVCLIFLGKKHVYLGSYGFV